MGSVTAGKGAWAKKWVHFLSVDVILLASKMWGKKIAWELYAEHLLCYSKKIPFPLKKTDLPSKKTSSCKKPGIGFFQLDKHENKQKQLH